MFKRLRNRKVLKKIEEVEVALAIIQGQIDYYEACLRINWDDSDKCIYSAMMLANYYNKKMEYINLLLQLKSELK